MKCFGLIGILAAVLSLNECAKVGRSFEGRIVGGEDIRIREAPYQISLRFYKMHICGGAIISKDFVITAAHCVSGQQPSHFSILAGTEDNSEGGDEHSVSAVTTHPWFNANTFDFDVALLKLKTPIKIDDRTKQEISLPNFLEFLPERTPVLVSGWGETYNDDEPSTGLRAVILAVSNQYQCHRKYISDGGVTNRMFCSFALNKDSCSGDSGGPVRRLSDGKLVGLVSFGPSNECASPDYPGVYTRLAAVRLWIKRVSKI